MVVGSLGTISNHGPPITLAGGEVLSLGSEGVVAAGGGQISTTIGIPGVQELVSTFVVGGQTVKEEYGVIVFSAGGGMGAAGGVAGSGSVMDGVATPTVMPFTGGVGCARGRVDLLGLIGGVLIAGWVAM